MIRRAYIFAIALLAVRTHAGLFTGKDWQRVYVQADDGQAYDFYANGKFLCSGKRCHTSNIGGDCRIEFVAKKADRIYGVLDFEGGQPKHSFIYNFFLGPSQDDDPPPCAMTEATVIIDYVGNMHLYKPLIRNHTDWSDPVENKEFLKPRKTPSYRDWQESPFKDEQTEK